MDFVATKSDKLLEKPLDRLVNFKQNRKTLWQNRLLLKGMGQ